ncbi:unnamed protein product [Closterium sp. NIES-53]
MYLMTCTRPDLAYPLSILARYVAPGRHRPEHMAASKRVLRYLCSTSGLGLVHGGRSPRSSQGYTFSLGFGSVSWRSTRSSSVFSSSCEAEIYAGAMAAQELRWLTFLLTDLGEPPSSPPVLYVDNKAMLALCREHRLEHRTKHIALRYFLAHELQQRGQLRLAYVASEANTADIFTEALQRCDHQCFCTMLGRAAFKRADGKPVVLHDVLLVPDLKANLISLRKLAKAGVSTSTDGARTYKGQLGNRVLWDLHESKDVYRSMWQLPTLTWHGGGLAGEGSACQGECNAVGGVGVKVSARSGKTDWATAHRRLGHEAAGEVAWEEAAGGHAEGVQLHFSCMAVTHVPKKYRSKLGASAIWCVHLGLAAESKGWLLWEPSKGVLFDSNDVKFVEGMMYGGWKKQPKTKVSQQMEQITMQLDLTPSVWEEEEEATAEGGENIQEEPAGGRGGVEASGSTSGAAGPEGEQQQGKAKAPILPQRRKPKGVVMKGWETPVSRPGRTRVATMKLTAGADVVEQQLGNEEALLILPHGYDPDEEDEPAYCFLALAPKELANMEEALAGPDREKWMVSRDAEYQSLLENGTWDLVVLPEGKKAVQCKWVLRIKTNDKGQVTICMSRLVAKGFMQKEKQDFNEICAPIAKPPTLRVLLADATVSWKSIIQIDISTAFLNGILEEDVYMTQPPGYEDGTGRVCKLKRYIYSLKQAPRCWYQKLAVVLEEKRFRTSSCDESLFLKGGRENLVLFLVYVDDILLFSSSMKEIQKVQQQLMKNFKCKTLGEVKYYLGMHNPSEEQVDAAERVVKYLNSHPSIGVQYSTSAQVKQKGVEVLKEKGEELGEGKLFLTCFTDATWASEKDDSSSVGGYICVVGGGLVSWRSKKQIETALSSVESEYMAMFHGVKEVIWLRRLLEEIGQEQKVATPLFCDSKGALGMAKNAVLHGLNKHMRIKWHWLRKEVKRGTVNPIYIKTHQQPADFLTKRLADEPHWRCVRMSGMSMN